MNKYEWSEIGLELLQRIAGLVLKNGGNIRCAETIEMEWKNPYQLEKAKKRLMRCEKIAWSQTEIQFLQANLHLSYEDISLQMKDRTPDAVRQKIWNLRQVNKIGSKVEARKNFKKI